MTRDELRRYFADKGLTYRDIQFDYLRLLETLCNDNFTAQRTVQSKGEEYWHRINAARYYKGHYDKDGRLINAYLTARGGRFKAREVISFNTDGFIGFCGEADCKNLVPVANSFVTWCDWLALVKI